MPCGVKDGCDYDHSVGLENFVHDLVGKALGESPANVFGGIAPGTMQRILLDLPENADQFLDESGAETGTFGLIPINCLCGVIPEFGTKNQLPTHLPISDLSCCFIFSKGTDDSGDARWPSRRS
jgi:hypothetical protein